ncbi:MAG: thioether cross-link-forming SCIFF peptide maturase [Clostridiales bacterium]|nr:thioether cross-link-forming SCIFF peptide maturase [Clostridiales bacterium]
MTHAYTLHNTHILIDAGSASVHVLPTAVSLVLAVAYEDDDAERAVAAALRAYPDADEIELRELIPELDALRRTGKLYAPPVEDKLPATRRTETENRELRTENSIKALCLHVAHACDMTCAYCFAGQGKFSGESALMSFDVGKRALDFLLAHSGARRNLEVDFFGGEPLLNLDVVKALVAYARSVEKEASKCFRFTFTTNGLKLDDAAMDFLNAEMVNVVLSCDGRRETHDRYRKYRRGSGECGSYDAVIPKFQRLVAKRGGRNYYIRGTYTRHNLDFCEDILHMAELGFSELSMEPVVSEPNESHALREEDLPVLYAQYERLAWEMLQRDFRFYHYNLDLRRGPCAHKRVAGCGSGTEYFAVTPSGELYPCHQFAGDAAYKMGDIWQGTTRPDLRQSFAENRFTNKPECRACFARLYCSGGCAANAYHVTGNIAGIYELGCRLFCKRIECAVWLAAVREVERGKRKEESEKIEGF